MKKLFFAALLALAFVACSKDEEEIKIPSITAINIDKATIGVGQNVNINATAIDPDKLAISYNWNVDGVSFDNANPIKTSFTKAGEHPVWLSITNANGIKKDTTFTVNVIDCDYGVALWDDNIDVVLDSETKTLMLNQMDAIYKFQGGGETMYYHASGGKVVKGHTLDVISLPAFNDSNLESLYRTHETKYSEMVALFGNPLTSDTTGIYTGNKTKDGLALVNGMLKLSYTFENSRTSVKYMARQYSSNSTAVLFDKEYSKK